MKRFSLLFLPAILELATMTAIVYADEKIIHVYTSDEI